MAKPPSVVIKAEFSKLASNQPLTDNFIQKLARSVILGWELEVEGDAVGWKLGVEDDVSESSRVD